MDPLISTLAMNAAVGLSTAALFYGSKYVALSSDTLLAETRPVTGKVFGQADHLSTLLLPRLEEFTDHSFHYGAYSGEELDSAKIVINNIKKRNGQIPDRNIFVDQDEEKVKVSMGLLFSNSVAVRNQRSSFLELGVQSLFDAMEIIPGIESCLAAYDKDLHLVKAFDDSYNVAKDGVLPKKKGYHAHLDRALLMMAEQFQESKKIKILYVFTGPLSPRRQDAVAEALEDIKGRGIHTAFIFVGKEPSESIAKNYVVFNDQETFPQKIGRVNDRMMEDL